ncbi:MAG: hypothetical protein P1U34_12235 [Coxiellaceae bacterium]|nr:hypothetical protein [Coxiellaceae bacterium]
MSHHTKALPWIATAGLVLSSSAIAFSPNDFHPLGVQINQLQYKHDLNTHASVQEKRSWKKPNVHGRGNGSLYLAAAKSASAARPSSAPNAAAPNGNPKKFPGEMWKPKSGNKQFPGEMWKGNRKYPGGTPKERGGNKFPGGMWKPKNPN